MRIFLLPNFFAREPVNKEIMAPPNGGPAPRREIAAVDASGKR